MFAWPFAIQWDVWSSGCEEILSLFLVNHVAVASTSCHNNLLCKINSSIIIWISKVIIESFSNSIPYWEGKYPHSGNILFSQISLRDLLTFTRAIHILKLKHHEEEENKGEKKIIILWGTNFSAYNYSHNFCFSLYFYLHYGLFYTKFPFKVASSLYFDKSWVPYDSALVLQQYKFNLNNSVEPGWEVIDIIVSINWPEKVKHITWFCVCAINYLQITIIISL